ncbi:MAG: hypothetical protein HY804_09115 [Nitrospinae bacterium]|nr:hypothetical protein [Nitrospinota bacterium]
MLTIERAAAFKRDYKKVWAAPRHRNIDSLLCSLLEALQTGHGVLRLARLGSHSELFG